MVADSPAPRVSLLPLWFGLLAGPAAWVLQLLLTYFLASLTCVARVPAVGLLLHLVTLVALAAVVAAGLVAWRAWRRLDGERTPAGEAPGRGRFMALAGMVSSGFFLIAIVAGGVPALFLAPCIPV